MPRASAFTDSTVTHHCHTLQTNNRQYRGNIPFQERAGDEARTRDVHLGKKGAFPSKCNRRIVTQRSVNRRFLRTSWGLLGVRPNWPDHVWERKLEQIREVKKAVSEAGSTSPWIALAVAILFYLLLAVAVFSKAPPTRAPEPTPYSRAVTRGISEPPSGA